MANKIIVEHRVEVLMTDGSWAVWSTHGGTSAADAEMARVLDEHPLEAYKPTMRLTTLYKRDGYLSYGG